MTLVPILHGKTYRLGPDDQAQFPAAIKTLVGDGANKGDGRYAYRWGSKGIAFIWDIEKLYATDTPKVYATKEATVTEPEPETPVTPPVVTPEPVPGSDILSAVVNGEAFIQNKYWTLGVNNFGGFGTTKNAPLGFRSQGTSPAPDGYTSTLYRVGLLSSAIPYADLVMQGRAQEGILWNINGVVSANVLLHGYYQVTGANADPFRWNGEESDIQYKQKIELDDDIVRIIMTNTNVGTKNATVLFGRVIDPDSVMNFVTTQKVLSAGVMEMKLDDGAKLTMTASGAQFYRSAYTAASNFSGTLIPVGTAARKADDTIKAIWPEVTLAPGESKTVVVEYRATAKPA